MVMEVSVSDFKSRCTKILRDLSSRHGVVKVTKRGTVVAIITQPVKIKKPAPEKFFRSLKGAASHSGDIVTPLKNEWDAVK